MKKIYSTLLIAMINVVVFAQQSTVTRFNIKKNKTIVLDEKYDVYKPMLYNHQLPKPAIGADKQTIAQVKKELMQYRNNQQNANNKSSNVLFPPALLRNFTGNAFSGFVPNDNDMAITNDEFVMSVTNVTVWNKDLATNIISGLSLHALSTSLGLQNEEFDPKVMYDPSLDRFVVLFLNGFSDSTSNVVVGFSQTNKPNGAWNFYSLPGNPFNNGLWTDFPMMALTNDELFITVNLLYPDSSWQTGFNETIIWQVNKHDGFNGNTLTSLVHNNIQYGGKPLRNLCPAKGGSQLYGPEMYFLSNRNFTTGNDTIFLVKVNDTINAPNQTVTVTPLVGNTAYHMPVDAAQPYVDLLATNDARVLGAFIENDKIQFTSNTFDTTLGVDGIFHGVISSASTAPSLTSTKYSNINFDFGYPNISYAGSGPNDDRSIISLLFSSPTVLPGFGAILFDGINDYSPITNIKDGLGYVNMLNGNERWGDYMGCQRKYNQPGLVWISGQYGLANHTTRTWIGEISANTSAGIQTQNTAALESEVYPNPATDMVNIKFNITKAEKYRIDIIDLSGKNVAALFSGAIITGPNMLSFSTASLPAGEYSFCISNMNSEKVFSEKFIKQ
nr:T9SS type A sorting domain-containing protein [Bacteroidota bacterium]